MKNKIIFVLLISLTALFLLNAVCAHDVEYPDVHIDTPASNDVVSGDVDFNMSIEDHHETLYVNVTATHKDTNMIYYNGQDSNPNDGWSLKWDTSDAPNGKYYVSAVAMNSKNLKGQYDILITLNNTKKSNDIVLDNTVCVAGEQNSVVAHLLDDESKPIANKNLDVEISGEKFSTQTGDDGAAIITFAPAELKDYNISVSFSGDNVYSPSKILTTLKVIANATVITVSDVTANNNQKTVLNANLKNKFGLVSGKTVDFYMNDVKIGSALTDENGDANLEYVVKEVGGTYSYSAQYGDENGTVKAFANLKVPESSIYLKINALTYSKDGIFTVGNNLKIIYTVFNDGPDTAEDVILKYTVPNSLKFVELTKSVGDADFNSTASTLIWNVGNVSVGNETLEVLFTAVKTAKNNVAPILSTATYDKSVNSNISRNTVVVKSYKLQASDLTKYYTGSDNFVIYVKDQDGTAISNAVVTITFNKQKIPLKTDSNGAIKLNTKNLGVGKYTIKATCANLAVSKKIVVKPLLITKNISKKKAKNVKYTAKLVNTKGKIVKNKKITFIIKGKKYTAKTNSKGIATVSLKNLKVGKYTVKTSYGKSTVKNTITIKK